MMWSARSSQVLLLPTEDEGINLPSGRMPATSTTATLSGPRKPNHASCATCERWMSVYCICPALICLRTVGSDW